MAEAVKEYDGAIDKGLEGVVACTTKISSIQDATLTYRGFTIEDLTDQIIDEVANTRAKPMWDNAGEFMQNKVRERVRAEVVEVSHAIALDMADDIDSIMDIERTVLEAIDRHKALMGEMFYEVGRQEFKFIERSGLYFGFLFGRGSDPIE